jgi:putative oxidoreductase
MSYGLLLLRVVLGLTMSAHGAQKLFGWFGGHRIGGTGGFFGNLGLRTPVLMAFAAGLAELAGGLSLATGFLTPLGALAVTIVMLNAIGLIHWSNGFFNGNGGFEFNLLIASAAVAIAATGPGRFAIDHAIGWDGSISGLWWGVGVLGAAVAIAFTTLTLGRHRHRVQVAQQAA